MSGDHQEGVALLQRLADVGRMRVELAGIGTVNESDNKPLTTARVRSLVFDLYGDFARFLDGRMRLLSIVRILECFDIAPAASRVTMARMRREGWFESEPNGRETVYALMPRAWRLLDEGRERLLFRPDDQWDGRWKMVIYNVPETDRQARFRIRRSLAWLGFGPLASSTWISPHDLLDSAARVLADEPSAHFDLFSAQGRERANAREIAARCWNLEELNKQYQRLHKTVERQHARFERGLSDEEALVERIRLIHDFRKLPFRDPGLPAELLPGHWSGYIARKALLDVHELLRAPAERFFEKVEGRQFPSGRGDVARRRLQL